MLLVVVGGVDVVAVEVVVAVMSAVGDTLNALK